MLPERYPRKPSVWFTSHSEMTSAMFTIQCACAIQTSCETSFTSADSKFISEKKQRFGTIIHVIFFMQTVSLINYFLIIFLVLKSI